MEQMRRKPLSERDIERLDKHRITIISPSTLEYYGKDCDAIVEELKSLGFSNATCRIIKDDCPMTMPVKERLRDAAVIEGKRLKL